MVQKLRLKGNRKEQGRVGNRGREGARMWRRLEGAEDNRVEEEGTAQRRMEESEKAKVLYDP